MRLWLETNRIVLNRLPVLTAPDLRALRNAVAAGLGWSVLPDYLARSAIERGELVRIETPHEALRYDFNLVWARNSLRHPRIARARELLHAALSE